MNEAVCNCGVELFEKDKVDRRWTCDEFQNIYRCFLYS